MTVDYATADGTATAPADYTAAGGNLVFAPGQITKTVDGPGQRRHAGRVRRDLQVNLADAVNAAIADGQGSGTITRRRPATHGLVGNATVTEGDTGTVNATFTVSLTRPSGKTITVDYATANGTATAPADYAAASGTLTFTPGQTTKTVDRARQRRPARRAERDVLRQPLEPVERDDRRRPGPRHDHRQRPASDGLGQRRHRHRGQRRYGQRRLHASPSSARAAAASTVNYATADGTATAPADYQATSGTLTFTPGQTTQHGHRPVTGDVLDEANETFTLNLTNAVNVTIADPQGTGTITDDDPAPTLSVNDVSVVEGNAGTTNATFTVSLSAPSGRAVTVDYATADGTAQAPLDYLATNGTLNFAPGQTSKTVTVLVNGDLLDEGNETFFLNLTNPANATISDGQGVGTITNDDGAPGLSVNDVTVTEGDSGTKNATFTVTLAPASGQNVSVNYATADGTATAPADYAATSGTLTFAPGQTTKTVTVPVVGDTLDELDETFTLNLSNAVNAAILDPTGLGTIVDNDPPPAITINDATVTEPDTGTVNATFTVSLTAASSRSITVDYATANGTATAPADYTAGSGTLTFTPGQTSKTITVPVIGDLLDEAERDVLRQPHEPVERDDRRRRRAWARSPTTTRRRRCRSTTSPSPRATRDMLRQLHGHDERGRAASASRSTSRPRTAPPRPARTTRRRAARSPSRPGETTKTVTVHGQRRQLDEANETFVVNLTNPSNATIADAQGLGTITDDDATAGARRSTT